ncbi:hypothetical protein MLD38_026938 [Melastoma candidum]|uniref:Uncharacterized protein n=1 Tax=Melastoma candidum TaxID=119954 RepID=A0ACB9NZX4_9MYRT|nr:hypothetical protein MLD38_026938 [Melastoma candidum]
MTSGIFQSSLCKIFMYIGNHNDRIVTVTTGSSEFRQPFPIALRGITDYTGLKSGHPSKVLAKEGFGNDMDRGICSHSSLPPILQQSPQGIHCRAEHQDEGATVMNTSWTCPERA